MEEMPLHIADPRRQFDQLTSKVVIRTYQGVAKAPE